MIKIFQTFGGYIEINEPQKACCINTTNPTKDEIQKLNKEFGLPFDAINDILDQDERPRIEFEDDWTLMIPTIVASIYGMNVPNFMEDASWAMPSIYTWVITFFFFGSCFVPKTTLVLALI